jgi:ribosome-binding factor A
MSIKKQERIISLLKELAAKYLQSVSNGQSLISVTDCRLSSDLKKATFFITVYPEMKEADALNFAKRHRTDLRTYIKDNSQLGRLPFLEIKVDEGEKYQQKIDDLLKHQ